MADMTITIRVTASIGGQAFAWTRTATVANIDAAVYGLNGPSSGSSGVTEALVGSTAVDGVYSYSGAAVVCVVHTNPGMVSNIPILDAAGAQRGGFLAVPFVPVIYYNGAGTGFTGGINSSNTATDTPTVDIVAGAAQYFTGSGPTATLIGLKAIS